MSSILSQMIFLLIFFTLLFVYYIYINKKEKNFFNDIENKRFDNLIFFKEKRKKVQNMKKNKIEKEEFKSNNDLKLKEKQKDGWFI